MHTYNNIQHTVKGMIKYRYLHMLYSLHPLDTVHYICMPTPNLAHSHIKTAY